jgi:hypothetical protein
VLLQTCIVNSFIKVVVAAVFKRFASLLVPFVAIGLKTQKHWQTAGLQLGWIKLQAGI